ncbi:MAG: anti-sigma factor domain-containing protein [Actinobacteria bacterium]|nr:anti-sigma factor domain-containing protein [Actinomycetota bacterium]
MATSRGAFRRIPARQSWREGQYLEIQRPQHAKISPWKMGVFWLLREYFVAG